MPDRLAPRSVAATAGPGETRALRAATKAEAAWRKRTGAGLARHGPRLAVGADRPQHAPALNRPTQSSAASEASPLER
jgi:hypothetical protein